MYFWRTAQQQEIDLVEDKVGDIFAYEFKWSAKNTKFPEKFIKEYNAKTLAVDRSNFREFVTIKK
jgi:hypothetical protein